jgi:ABC-type multidrug transport system ATPase subunit
MNGHIVLRNQEELRAFALGKNTTGIGSGPAADLVIDGPGIEPIHATLTWEPRASTWVVTAASPSAARSLKLNGRACASAASLEDGDLIEFPGGAVIRFGAAPSLPRFGDKETREISLRGITRITLGRAAGDAWGDSGKVQLDPEDARISRNHLEIEATAPGVVFATDKSTAGTLLNGQRFDRRQLIVGDRLRLGGYNFEFTGTALRLVATYGGAKVEARNLSFTLRDGRNILTDVSLDIAPCSFVGILGGSGQGKSTLMNALCGVNPATGGEVYINGARLGDPREMAAAGIGYVPQDDIVHRELTVTEAITYSARLKLPSSTPRAAVHDLVEETIERLGLTEHKDKRITQLSGGQRKRVSIAAELLAKPSVLFLDEPSSGLDPKTEFDLMSLLRRLAGADCTVVCTTHVLGRAYLFDQLCFVHGGQLIFTGTPDEAITWFKAEHGLEEIYLKVGAAETKTGADWRREFENSRAGARPLAYLAPVADETAPQRQRRRGPGYPGQLGLLLQRQWSILKADRLNLLFLLAQPLFIGLLIGWVSDDEPLRMFLCVVATLWFGCSNGAQQIVREIAVFRRERVCGLGLNGYLQSKYGFLTFVTALQAMLLLVVTLASAHLLNPSKFKPAEFYQKMAERMVPPPASSAAADPAAAAVNEFELVTEENKNQQKQAAAPETAAAAPKPPDPGALTKAVLRVAVFFEAGQGILDSTDPGEGKTHSPGAKAKTFAVFGVALGLRLAALFGAAFVGVAIGLAISAMVRTETQAVMWVPLVLIPQILFGGIVVTRPEMSASVRATSEFIPSYCAQRLMDVAGIYGQTTPRISNRTKYPVFLTPTGEQEEITWEEAGQSFTEKYDRVSDWNKSWQNLIVFPTRVGQHHQTFRVSRGVQKYDESTEQRNDVRYAMGKLYLYADPALISLLILGGWIVACYGGTLVGLTGKQQGK